MFIYLVTSKLTFSRAIIVAASLDDAIRTHPEGGPGFPIICEPDADAPTDWRAVTYGGFPRGQTGTRPLPLSLVWPAKISNIEAKCIGRAHTDIAPDVWCWQPDPDPRV